MVTPVRGQTETAVRTRDDHNDTSEISEQTMTKSRQYWPLSEVGWFIYRY
jgi:hypothetical protein